MCFHIRKSPDHWLCAPTRSLSQLITSFIGSWCQGIHHAPFVAWPLFVYYALLLRQLRNLLVHVPKVLFTTYISRFLVLSHTKLHNHLLFQSFAFNITKNISWLTSQYVLKLYIIHVQFSKNKIFSYKLRITSSISSFRFSLMLISSDAHSSFPCTACLQQ